MGSFLSTQLRCTGEGVLLQGDNSLIKLIVAPEGHTSGSGLLTRTFLRGRSLWKASQTSGGFRIHGEQFSARGGPTPGHTGQRLEGFDVDCEHWAVTRGAAKYPTVHRRTQSEGPAGGGASPRVLTWQHPLAWPHFGNRTHCLWGLGKHACVYVLSSARGLPRPPQVWACLHKMAQRVEEGARGEGVSGLSQRGSLAGPPRHPASDNTTLAFKRKSNS